MDTAELKVELLRLLAEDPEVRAAVYRAVTVDVEPVVNVDRMVSRPVEVRERPGPPWLRR